MAANRHDGRFNAFGIRQTLRGLGLLLLSGLGPEAISDQYRHRTGPPFGGRMTAKESAPYLPAIGSPGLRFREPEPVPAMIVRPVAVGSPMPGLNVIETTVAVANTTASLGPLNPTQGSVDPANVPPVEQKPTPTKKPAPAILPDDAKPPVRPEDFLPYFQIPGAVPPSSATYQQSKE